MFFSSVQISEGVPGLPWVFGLPWGYPYPWEWDDNMNHIFPVGIPKWGSHKNPVGMGWEWG